MQISPEVMHQGVATIYEQQNAIGYESTFIEGADESMRYMKGLSPQLTQMMWKTSKAMRKIVIQMRRA